MHPEREIEKIAKWKSQSYRRREAKLLIARPKIARDTHPTLNATKAVIERNVTESSFIHCRHSLFAPSNWEIKQRSWLTSLIMRAPLLVHRAR
jgi:hypothetical protein